jgi:hypothetical protein
LGEVIGRKWGKGVVKQRRNKEGGKRRWKEGGKGKGMNRKQEREEKRKERSRRQEGVGEQGG